jgi:K+-transporting ATPase, c chain/Response regulator receiver domain
MTSQYDGETPGAGATAPTAAGAPPGPAERGARVLVVDDDPSILRAVRTNLAAHSYAVQVAETGEEALDGFLRHRPDVILLDLPDLDGLAVISQNVSSDKYFQPRPSAAGEFGYDAAASGGSNLGPTNKKLLDQVQERADAYRKLNGLGPTDLVPGDAVTASSSGLDPHVSPANAALQVAAWPRRASFREPGAHTGGPVHPRAAMGPHWRAARERAQAQSRGGALVFVIALRTDDDLPAAAYVPKRAAHNWYWVPDS